MCLCLFFFFFKQKTAYEMRISDWSSDVCSSDLAIRPFRDQRRSSQPQHQRPKIEGLIIQADHPREINEEMKMATTDIRVPHGKLALEFGGNRLPLAVLKSHRGYYLGTYDDCGPVSRESAEYWPKEDRKSVVSGKSVSVRVDLGGGRII